jgi:uncharacterized protein (DUF2267 family)
MTTGQLDVIDRSVEQAHIWINDVADGFGTDDRQLAYRILRAFLHAVRDRVTVEESAQLAAQLPLLVRGIYYEGWRPAATPQSYRDRETFLRRIADEAILEGLTEASYASEAAMAALRRHISGGEIDDVLAIMPGEIRELLAGRS